MSEKIDYREIMNRMKSDVDYIAEEAYQRGYDKGYADKTNNVEACNKIAKDIQDEVGGTTMGRREALTYHDLATIVRLEKNGLLDCLEGFSTKTAVEATGRILSASHQRIVVGQAARLIEEMISRGGTKEDLLDAIKYGLCCLDANKYGLDLDDAQIKFRYRELYSKYMLKEAKHE